MVQDPFVGEQFGSHMTNLLPRTFQNLDIKFLLDNVAR
jgi:hypothetical protein